MTNPADELLTCLQRARTSNDPAEQEHAYRLVEDYLRQQAHRECLRADHDPLLQTTDLVDHAFQQLIVAGHGPEPATRCHFFHLATKVMRHRRVDFARRRLRRQEAATMPLSRAPEPVAADSDTLEGEEFVVHLDAALQELEQVDEPAARAFTFRYFGSMILPRSPELGTAVASASGRSMTYRELGALLDCSEAQAWRHYQRAVDWLRVRLASFRPE